MIYAIGKLQNPLPGKTMLREAGTNNSAGRSDAFLHSYGFRLATQQYMTGEGAFTPIADTKRERTRKILKRHWCSNYFWQDLRYLYVFIRMNEQCYNVFNRVLTSAGIVA